MPSVTKTRRGAANEPGKGALQRLRRQAGFKAAKDFAGRLGIPTSTYSRYERAEAGPGCGIPLPAAWAMADELGCSIDALVGRSGIDEAPSGPTLDERVAALSVMDRGVVMAFVEFVEERATAQAAALAASRKAV